ncbi:MAG: hypothetical protein ABSB83_00695 [Methanomassiliicoccales archaeon]|jgi:hypothetical protein
MNPKNATSTESMEQDQTEALELAKKVFDVVDTFRFTLWWVMIMVGLAIIYAAFLAFGGSHWSYFYEIFILTFIVMIVLAIFSGRRIIRAAQALKDWNERYVSYAFLTVFEFSPRSKDSLLDDVVWKLRRIFPSIDRAVNKNPEIVDFDHSIKGKKGTYTFDAVINMRDSLVLIELVRNKTEMVNAEYVRTFMENLSKLVKDAGSNLFEVLLISDVGFADDALNYVADEEHWVSLESGWIAPTLIKTTQSGYQIEWMQARHHLARPE